MTISTVFGKHNGHLLYSCNWLTDGRAQAGPNRGSTCLCINDLVFPFILLVLFLTMLIGDATAEGPTKFYLVTHGLELGVFNSLFIVNLPDTDTV